MKKIVLGLLLLPALVIAQTGQKKSVPVKKPVATTTAPKSNMKSGLDSLSYALGTRIAMNLQANNIDTLNYALFTEGVRDVLRKNKVKLDNGACEQVISKELQKVSSNKSSAEKKISAKFLEANKKRPEVTTTASGLQYEVITMGTGIKATLQDTVVCHYRGTLLSGKEFDNSYTRGEPISFPVNGVIKGWTEAVQLMPKGSKWKLYIPSDLGYGDAGAGSDIPGGAALIFEVELVDVKVKQ